MKDSTKSKMLENKKKWTVSLLKECLGIFGCDKSGSRDELIQRLVNYIAVPKELKSETRSAVKKRKLASKTSTSQKPAKKAKKGAGKGRDKRPASGYILFCNSVRAEVTKAHPDKGVTEHSKVISVRQHLLFITYIQVFTSNT